MQVDAEGPLRHWFPLNARLGIDWPHPLQLRICPGVFLPLAFLEGASATSESLPLAE